MSENTNKINGTFEYLPIEKLVLRTNIFDYKNPSLTELEESIRKHGMLQPLTVIGPYEGERYAILDGVERYQVANKINETSSKREMEVLPCFILPVNTINTKEGSRIIWPIIQGRVTNKEKREYERFYMLFTLFKMKKEGIIKKKSTITKIFQSTQGLSERAARSYKNVYLSGNKELVEAVICDGTESGRAHIKVEVAEQIARLDRDKQKEIIDYANSGKDIRAILDVTRQVERKKRERGML